MSHGHPSSNICIDHFYPIEEENTNVNKYSTSHQICKYCNKDVVDLIDCLKDHLNKCSFFSYKLQESTDLATNNAYSQECKYLENKLENINNISLVSDGCI
ncbi:8583_t:CDS:2, partial [Cetraspora pellucida]